MFGRPETTYAEDFYKIEEGADFGFVVGLDLGRQNDYTALVVNDVQTCRRVRYVRAKYEPLAAPAGPGRRLFRHRLTNLHRYPLGTTYPEIYRSVQAVLGQLPARERRPELVVDATGVGLAVTDSLREMGMRPIAVTITGGRTVNEISHDTISVPKSLLASALDIVLAEDRLDITTKAAASQVMRKEMQNFRVRVRASGTESFEAWRESDHDDMVLAAALAIWRAEARAHAIEVRFVNIPRLN